jgi:hypothetical protein
MNNKLKLAALLSLITFYSAASLSAESGGVREIYHRKNPHALEAAPAGSTGVVTPAISYHNGDLISTPNIYYIWYRSSNFA